MHGGIIGSFLEITAIIQLSWAIVLERKDDQIKLKKSSLEVQETILQRIPKTIDITIDYLNSGRPVESFARAKINKIGRRYASVSVKSWQDEPNKPFAMASGHFLVKDFSQTK